MKDINQHEKSCLVRSMTYVLNIEPLHLKRASPHPRKLCRMYDSQKQEKLICGLELKRQHGDFPFFEGPLKMAVIFYIRTPEKKKYLEGTYHYCKPDNSNLIKFIEDVGNGILYKDDALIAWTDAIKIYSSNPRIEFTITYLGEV